MEVHYSQDSEPGMLLKNGLKEGKEGKDSQGNISKSFLKDQQESFSPSGPVENCEKSRTSSGDPDYCRRILVRGKLWNLWSFLYILYYKKWELLILLFVIVLMSC